jgi:hypothetical protein
VRLLDQAKADLKRFRFRDRFFLRDELERLPYDRERLLSARPNRKDPGQFRVNLTAPYVALVRIEGNELVVESVITEVEIDTQFETVIPRQGQAESSHRSPRKRKK